MYLICDGGYLRWVTLICPYAGTHDEAGRCGYFNGNLESVRKTLMQDRFFFGADWTHKAPGFEDQSTWLRSNICCKICLRPNFHGL
jgi:hypothetical protein